MCMCMCMGRDLRPALTPTPNLHPHPHTHTHVPGTTGNHALTSKDVPHPQPDSLMGFSAMTKACGRQRKARLDHGGAVPSRRDLVFRTAKIWRGRERGREQKEVRARRVWCGRGEMGVRATSKPRARRCPPVARCGRRWVVTRAAMPSATCRPRSRPSRLDRAERPPLAYAWHAPWQCTVRGTARGTVQYTVAAWSGDASTQLRCGTACAVLRGSAPG